MKSPGLVASTFTCCAIGTTLVHFNTHSVDWAEKETEEGGARRYGRIQAPCRLHIQLRDGGRLVMASPLPKRAMLPWMPMHLGMGNPNALSSPQAGRCLFLEKPGAHTEGEGLY